MLRLLAALLFFTCFSLAGLGIALADIIRGTSDNDTLEGGSGQDTIDGSDGDDTLRGAGGNDIIDGGFGNDTIEGGDGTDNLILSTDYVRVDSAKKGYDAVSNGEFTVHYKNIEAVITP